MGVYGRTVAPVGHLYNFQHEMLILSNSDFDPFYCAYLYYLTSIDPDRLYTHLSHFLYNIRVFDVRDCFALAAPTRTIA